MPGVYQVPQKNDNNLGNALQVFNAVNGMRSNAPKDPSQSAPDSSSTGNGPDTAPNFMGPSAQYAMPPQGQIPSSQSNAFSRRMSRNQG